MAKIKDTDYLAISARIRAMETTLLTAERMERLLEARSGEEVSKLLQECGYPELDAARPEAMDAALSQAREALLADLGDSAPVEVFPELPFSPLLKFLSPPLHFSDTFSNWKSVLFLLHSCFP